MVGNIFCILRKKSEMFYIVGKTVLLEPQGVDVWLNGENGVMNHRPIRTYTVYEML